MLDHWLSKTRLKKLVEKLAEKLFLGGISANSLTIIGLMLGILSALFIFLSGVLQWTFEFLIIAVITMSSSFFVDTLDGALARLSKPTTFGGILDIFCDRTVEICIIISLISTDPLNLMWPGIFLLGAIVLCITMFLIVGGTVKEEDLEEGKKVIYYRRGLIERSETFVFLMLTVILPPFRYFLMWLFAFLVFITALLRLRDAYLIFNKK